MHLTLRITLVSTQARTKTELSDPNGPFLLPHSKEGGLIISLKLPAPSATEPTAHICAFVQTQTRVFGVDAAPMQSRSARGLPTQPSQDLRWDSVHSNPPIYGAPCLVKNNSGERLCVYVCSITARSLIPPRDPALTIRDALEEESARLYQVSPVPRTPMHMQDALA